MTTRGILGDVRASLRAMLVLTVLAGGLYPIAMAGVAALAWPDRATGSPVRTAAGVVGSRWVGQPFEGPEWFHGRPGLVAPAAGTLLTGSASNLSPTDARQRDAIAERATAWREANPAALMPAEMLTASGSGVDPHISPEAAGAQVARVALARGVPPAALDSLVRARTEPALLGVLGAPRVNVLELNLAIDTMARRRP
jgi:potassium-transporting ATPase KdpC subunit